MSKVEDVRALQLSSVCKRMNICCNLATFIIKHQSYCCGSWQNQSVIFLICKQIQRDRTPPRTLKLCAVKCLEWLECVTSVQSWLHDFCSLMCVSPVYLCLCLWVCRHMHVLTEDSFCHLRHRLCQMLMLSLSQQMDLFHSDLNKHVLFSSIVSSGIVHKRPALCHLPIPHSVYATISSSLYPSHWICLWLVVFSPHKHCGRKSLLSVASASETNLRNEPITFSSP